MPKVKPEAPPPKPEMDNSGKKPICVPGFGWDLDFEFPYDSDGHERFAHGANDWKLEHRLTVREVSMLGLMNALTDKLNWNEKVFDEEIIEKWRQEALAMPFISEKAWEWCLAELRDKARKFEKTGYVSALDNGSGCIKSDRLVGEELRQELIDAVRPLQDVPAENRDWHPRSNDQVLNLVHPSLFPLVYGQTRVLTQGGQVGLENLLDSCGAGEIAPVQEPIETRSPSRYTGHYHEVRDKSRWSKKFQWLPCEVEFQGDEGNDVKITSYINNLHPTEHKELYSVMEKLIGLSIEPWNRVLLYNYENRTPLRICTYGYQFEPPWPEWASSFMRTWSIERKEVGDTIFEDLFEKTREYMKLPDAPDYQEDEEDYFDPLWETIEDGTWEQNKDINLHSVIDWKWRRMRKTKHPEVGEAYSYEDWKAGRIGKTVVSTGDRLHDVDLRHEWYDVDLGKTWRVKGLQVIIKLSSIELTPENPEYDGGNWHIEGMLNEHIVATSIYYYDVENTTESRIRFRQETDLEHGDMDYEQGEFEPLCEIFGTDSLVGEPAVQEIGSIATPQSRLLAFPNTLQHRVEPFRLEDPKRPGHRRFVVMWLVDPNYRIVSTRNVPPQRHDWWKRDSYHRLGIGHMLPAELADMVLEEVGEWPMGMEEAKKLRLELMDERTFMTPLLEANFDEYNFCEH